MSADVLREHRAVNLTARHIAPCGMNSALCLAYVRDRKSCPGCRGEDSQKPLHCVNCSIRRCDGLREKEGAFCNVCGKFPCKRLKQLDKRYREKYGMSMVDNLMQIHAEGMDAFLAGQVSKWSCASCGGFKCAHRGYCIKCGT